MIHATKPIEQAGYTDHAKVSEIRYNRPMLSKEHSISYRPQGLWTPKIDEENIAYQSMFKPFSLNQYLYTRPPIDMGLLDEDMINCPVNVLRMPLKYPKSSTFLTDGSEYRIPYELSSLLPLIKRVAEYEAFINTNHNDMFCHITFDHSEVKANEYHRFPGFHGDGIQGTKLTPKINVEHSYIVTTNPATEFCLQPFFLKHLDESKHNYFFEFDKQAKKENILRSLPNHLYLIDPYMVHRTPKIKKNVARTFVRITYAHTELQHPKNTYNPLFEDMQGYEKRIDIRENLTRHEFGIPYHLYGFSK